MKAKKQDVTISDLNALRVELIQDAIRGGKIADLILVAELTGKDYHHPFDRGIVKTMYKRIERGGMVVMCQRRDDWGQKKVHWISVTVGEKEMVGTVMTGTRPGPNSKYLPGDWERWVGKKAIEIKAAIKAKDEKERAEELDAAWKEMQFDKLPDSARVALGEIVEKRKSVTAHNVYRPVDNVPASVIDADLFDDATPSSDHLIPDHGVSVGDTVKIVGRKTVHLIFNPPSPLVEVEYGDDGERAWMCAEDVEEIRGGK